MDCIEWLLESDVDMKKSGKNVSAGWIGIKCLFCDDSSYHLGIRVKDLRCSCWKCGSHSIVSVVQEITHCSRQRARSIVKEFDQADENELLNDQKYHVEKAQKYLTKLPTHLTTFPQQYKQYLLKRKFHPNRTRRKYELLAAGNVGDYNFRIIIPLYIDRKLVTFTSRAIFDEMEPKYYNAKVKDSLLSPRDCVYNYDNIYPGKDCMIVEGPVDVWRFGDGSCATIGIQFTQSQLIFLRRKQIRNLFIMMDAERFAQRVKAEEIARLMGPWISGRVELLEAKWKKDLGDFSFSEANTLRKRLNFKGSATP
jgi:DNA primase